MENGKKLRMVELFSGIGAQSMALEELGIPFESTCCEIDEKAHKSYCAIHGETPNLGDITALERLPEADLITWSFPCTDLSIASGTQKGFAEGSGTRSALAWEVIRLLKVGKAEGTLPEYLLMENVPAILNKRNLPEFKRLVKELEGIGYTSTYEVLNAKDYGVPQNRKRCFMVSTLTHGKFRFPAPCPDGRVLKDVLEPAEDIPDKLWLSKEKIARYEEHCQRNMAKGNNFGWNPPEGNGVAGSVTTKADRQYSNYIIQTGKLNLPGWNESICRVYDAGGVSPSITTSCGGGHMPKIKWPSGTQKGWMEAGDGDGLVMARPLTARGTVQPQQAPTVTCGNTTGVCVRDPREAVQDALEGKLRIRYLSPLEAWRLQGFSDEAFRAAKAVPTSDTQLYKQAGNSIAVPCLKAIFKGMLIDETWKDTKAPKALDAYFD